MNTMSSAIAKNPLSLPVRFLTITWRFNEQIESFGVPLFHGGNWHFCAGECSFRFHPEGVSWRASSTDGCRSRAKGIRGNGLDLYREGYLWIGPTLAPEKSS